MTNLAYIWGMLVLVSVSSFAIISVIIIINGYGEIKDIFKKLGEKAESN